MTQQKTSCTPDRPAMDPCKMLRTIKSMASPECYGAELGLAWALTASPQVLEQVAMYPTADEKLEELVSIHDECARRGISVDDNDEVVAPDCDGDAPPERVEFFAWAKTSHLAFWGKASPEDPGVTYCNEDNQAYFFFDTPNYAFRLFERGWAKGVRQVYAAGPKLPSL